MSAERETLMDEMLNVDANTGEKLESVESTQAPVTEDSVIDELAAFDGDLTAEQLRKLPGADKHTDEELEQMWQEAIKPPKQRGYKFFKDDAEVADLSNLTVEDVLDNLKIAYNAMGKQHTRTFDEVIRNAQLGHYNESRMQQIMHERNTAAEQLQKMQEEITGYKSDRQTWDYVLNQYLQGNAQPLEKLLESVKQTQAALPQVEHQPQEDSAQLEAAGQKVYYEVVLPSAYQLATTYGADAQEVATAIMQLVENEPAPFMSAQRLQAIIQYDLPMLLEQNGYSANGQTASPSKEDPVAELKKQVAELQAQLKNTSVSVAKGKKAPPAGGGVTPSSGEEMASIKTRQDMKNFLRS